MRAKVNNDPKTPTSPSGQGVIHRGRQEPKGKSALPSKVKKTANTKTRSR
jgi:hypothetical protein